MSDCQLLVLDLKVGRNSNVAGARAQRRVAQRMAAFLRDGRPLSIEENHSNRDRFCLAAEFTA